MPVPEHPLAGGGMGLRLGEQNQITGASGGRLRVLCGATQCCDTGKHAEERQSQQKRELGKGSRNPFCLDPAQTPTNRPQHGDASV